MEFDTLRAVIRPLLTSGSMADRVAALNMLRGIIADYSPFQGEPVDYVQWLPADTVAANDYNPNSVAPSSASRRAVPSPSSTASTARASARSATTCSSASMVTSPS